MAAALVVDPHEHHWFSEPTEPVSKKYVTVLVIASVIGAVLLSIGSVNNQNYTLLLYVAGIAALVGAIVVLPIKKVK